MPPTAPVILVADDEEMVLNFVGLVLKKAGFGVLPAPGGAAALKLVAQRPEPPDLALLDIVMPHMDGPRLCRSLRDLYPNLRVLFMSGYNEEEVNRRCGGGIMDADLIKKPFTATELLSRVRRIIERPASLNA
jgi:two-component system cell cycle sensor histidine kinase/response regulator CckA